MTVFCQVVLAEGYWFKEGAVIALGAKQERWGQDGGGSDWGPGTPTGARGQWECLQKKCTFININK